MKFLGHLIRRLAPALLLLPLLCDSGHSLSATDPVPELWFHVGEKLTYKIYWGIIPVGRAVVTTEWAEKHGKRYLVIQFRTRTNRVLEKLYPVNDFIEAVIDAEPFLPLRFTKTLSEGSYRCDETTRFDYNALMAHWKSRTSGKSLDFQIEPDTRDIVTFMYFIRAKPFQPETKTQYRVMADETLYDLWVKAEEIEDVKLPVFGKVRSLKIEPEAAFGGVFVRKGRMWAWVSDDERRIITKLVARVPVASIALYLVKVEGPGDDFWITKSREEYGAEDEEDDEEVKTLEVDDDDQSAASETNSL